jgi:hypothetical protein
MGKSCLVSFCIDNFIIVIVLMKLVGGGINLKRETLSSVLQNAVLIVTQFVTVCYEVGWGRNDFQQRNPV